MRRRSPRVVQVTTTDISLLLLLGPQLTAIQDAGYEVVGLSAPGPYVPRLEALGIHHLPLRHATRAMAPGRDVAAFAELVRMFRDLEPEIVHTHNPKPGIYGRLAARAARVPNVVNTVHGLYAQAGDSTSRRAVVYGLERIAARCSDAELVQNVEDMAVLRKLGIPAAKLHLLGNGIDLERFDRDSIAPAARAALRREWSVPDNAVVCGVVGRLVAEKGYRELFNAAALLRSAAPQIHFVVVGPTDDDKADALSKRAIGEAQRLGNLHFAGERADIERCYTAFDMYALASYREGFPRSAMEAAAMGLPIVETNIRGCRQVVEDDITGRLVAPRDAFALATAIHDLAETPHLLAKMGSAAREKARKEFDQQRCIDITLGVYEKLLGRSAPAEFAA
jgi:glycosyltransferase involved in cell wall biosynthesis